MANEIPRDRAIVPSFPATAEGGIDVWIRVLRDQARTKLCFHLISGVARADRPTDEIAEERLSRDASVQAVTDGRIPLPFNGDSKSERRLATLLWRWTDQKVDWVAFL